jgi:hypothetical protein
VKKTWQEILGEVEPRRGGAGRGQGRKPLDPGHATVTVSIRMTSGQRLKLAKLGGAAWVRQQINGAKHEQA